LLQGVVFHVCCSDLDVDVVLSVFDVLLALLLAGGESQPEGEAPDLVDGKAGVLGAVESPARQVVVADVESSFEGDLFKH
jgi:hypothetical protein